MMEIEAMTDAEVRAELDQLSQRLTPSMLTEFESELYLRAMVLGWTGDPLRQPARCVLAVARMVVTEGKS